jgi:hypothetical protein
MREGQIGAFGKMKKLCVTGEPRAVKFFQTHKIARPGPHALCQMGPLSNIYPEFA